MTHFAIQVFKTITDHYSKRSNDIYRITCTHSSFEEWLMWEAYLACATVEGWDVQIKPPYRNYGVASKLGDIQVWNNKRSDLSSTSVFMEIAHLHQDNRNDKWRDKINDDTLKLQSLTGITNLCPVQYVIAVSYDDIAKCSNWGSYFGCIPIWQRPTNMEANFVLEPDGSAMAKAWIITSSSE